MGIFSAVQHERAPRSTQTNYHHHHHYPLTLTSRIRNTTSTIPNASIFNGLPSLHHNSIIEPTTTTSIQPTSTLHPHYLPHSFLYQGMMNNFSKPLITTNLGKYK